MAGQIEAASDHHEAAVVEFTSCLEKDPAYRTAYYRRGESLCALKRRKQALADYAQFLAMSPAGSENDPMVVRAQEAIRANR